MSETHSKPLEAWLADTVIALRAAVTVAGICLVVGLLVNLAHPEAIPFIADREHEIFAPCPEPGGEVAPMPANDPVLFAEDTFVVDARSKPEFDAWHFRQPVNVPYDYLDATPQEVLHHLAKAIARSHSKRVVVYGDGDVPDTGEWLAKELSSHGIKHVFFVNGGAPKLRSLEQPGADR